MTGAEADRLGTVLPQGSPCDRVIEPAWPMVGRDREIEAIVAAVCGRRAGGVILSGVPGVGKTRLMREAMAALAARGVATRWLGDTSQGSRSPAVVAIDDVRQLDPARREAGHEPVPGPPTVVMMTVCAGARAPELPARAVWRLETAALTREDTGRLVRAVLDGDVSGTTEAMLWSATLGNCGLLRELIATGRALGVLSCRDRRWHWHNEPHAVTRLHSRLESQLDWIAAAQLDALEHLIRPWTTGARIVEGLRRRHASRLSPHRRDAPARVTPRELAVLVLMAEGLTAASIARRLGVTPSTVTKHQENLYRKLETSDRLTTVLRAYAAGLLSRLP